jgi:hypothetical protein
MWGCRLYNWIAGCIPWSLYAITGTWTTSFDSGAIFLSPSRQPDRPFVSCSTRRGFIINEMDLNNLANSISTSNHPRNESREGRKSTSYLSIGRRREGDSIYQEDSPACSPRLCLFHAGNYGVDDIYIRCGYNREWRSEEEDRFLCCYHRATGDCRSARS